MERIRLDYQRQERPLPRAGLLILLLALAMSAVTGDRYLTLRRDLADAKVVGEALQATAQQRGIELGRRGKADGERGEEIRYANDVVRQLTLPWDRLFETIEASGSRDVALLSLTPDREKRVVRIGIEAKNAAAGLSYMKVLEGCDIFQTVRIQSHQIQLQDPEKPVRFTLLAIWKTSP